MFIEGYLCFTADDWAGKPFELEQWQRDFVKRLFGWRRRDASAPNGKWVKCTTCDAIPFDPKTINCPDCNSLGRTVDDARRRYTRAYMEVPRKNGKSELIAALGLYCLIADGVERGEVYAAAGDRKQAGRIFEPAKYMVMNDPDLRAACKTYKRSITHIPSGSVYEVLSADADSKHGLNASVVLFDELHVQKKRDLYDALKTSQKSRREPLFIMITTAGIYDPESIAWEIHDYAEKVLTKVIPDEAFLATIYKASEKDDWTSEKVWAKANPNLGVSVRIENLREECEEAQHNVAKENTFRRLALNQWTQQVSRWVSIKKWDECYAEYTEEDMLGLECYGGLDIGSVSDFTSFVLGFPVDNDVIRFLPYTWCCEARLRDTKNKYRDSYLKWYQDGHLRITEGDVVDYETVKADILEIVEKFDFKNFNVDTQFQGAQLAQQLDAEGLTAVPMRQGHLSYAAPMQEFEERLLSKRIQHNGDPILRFAVNNVVVATNTVGNVKPDKASAHSKIDPFVSMVMSLERIMRREDMGSVYSDRAATGEEMITWIE